MKETTKVASTIDKAFEMCGFSRRSDHGSGRKYYLCPQCSADRKGYNRSAKCVGVNIDEYGLRSFCNHCDYENVVMLESAVEKAKAQHKPQQGTGQGRSLSERAMPKQNGYAPLHKAARASWSRR